MKTDHDNRERILDAATQLIIEKGPDNTSLADIARRIDISKGTLYYYYPTKSVLIFDVTERHVNGITHEILKQLKELRKGSSPQKILEMVFTTILDAQTRTHLHIYLLQEAIANNESLKDRFRENYQKWKYLIKRGLGNALEDPRKNEILAEIIMTCLDGTIIQKMLGIKEIPISGIIQFLLRDFSENTW